MYRKPADGSSNEVLLYGDNLLKNPGSFSPDSRYPAYTALDPNTGFDIWLLPDPLGAPGASKPYPFLRTQFNEQYPRFSPDGRWIAYYSNESGRNEVYVSPFPGPGGKSQVSTAGGTAPLGQKTARSDPGGTTDVTADIELISTYSAGAVMIAWP